MERANAYDAQSLSFMGVTNIALSASVVVTIQMSRGYTMLLPSEQDYGVL